MNQSRVLIASHYNATRFVYDTSCYEMVAGFADCDVVDVLAPSTPRSSGQIRVDTVKRRLKSLTGLGTCYRIEPVEVKQDYELFVYIGTGLPDLVDIARIRHWRRRAKRAVCVILKAYGGELKQFEDNLAILNLFDIVYSGTWTSLAFFQSIVRPPVRYLAYGIPALEMMPASTDRERTIDVYAMGRRLPALHDQLLREMRSGSINYVFDSFDSSVPFIKDFAGHCSSKAQCLKQTKFFPNFGIRSFQSRELELAGADDSITYRCYEGAAAGTVMFGSAPTSPDYALMFDWEDAIIPAPASGCDYLDFLHGLVAQTDRMNAIRRRNVSNALLKHDLAYRFEAILKDLGMAAHEKLEERKQALLGAADRIGRPTQLGEATATTTTSMVGNPASA
jgi:Glycosyl transferases group 1